MRPVSLRHFSSAAHLRRYFRLEARHFEFEQGVRAALGICVPVGMGLILNQLAGAVIVTMAAWLVLLSDVGGAYRQKALAMSSATVGCAFAVLLASLLEKFFEAQVVCMFVWIACTAFIGIYGNSAATVSFVTSVMYVITAALPYPDDLRLRFILCLTGGIWALSLSLALWPLHAFTAVLQATGRCYERLAELIEAACSATPAVKERFPITYETVLAAIGSARQNWTAVRVRRAGPSARSIQLLTLIENAAHLSHTAVALHEQMVLVSAHPRFQFVHKEFERASVALGQLTRSIAGAIYRRGGQVDVRDLDNAQRSLEQAFEELRSSNFQQVQDYAVLPPVSKLLRGVKLIADNLRMDAGVAENLATGRLDEASEGAFALAGKQRSVNLLSIFRDNLTLRSVSFRHAIRLGAVAALAFALGEYLHVRRGYWVVVTVLVVLRPNFGGTIERVAQRIGGTLIGGIIALGISLIIREREILFLALGFLAFASFSVRPLGYGVFTLVLTPLFMVLLDLASPGSWEINLIRIEDTLIGGVLALGGSYLLFPIWERELLPVQLARSISALKEYFDKIVDLYLGQAVNSEEVDHARHQANLEVANAATASQRVLSEPIRVRDEIEPMLTLVNFARRLILTLAALDEHVRGFPGRGQLAGLREFAKETSGRLGNLAQTLAGSADLEGNTDLDWRLAEMRDRVDRLGETRLGEFAQNVKRELTSTAFALREQFVILAQLQRIAEHVTVLYEAVARLKLDQGHLHPKG
jgi:uncharacterized membrane protein YccC